MKRYDPAVLISRKRYFLLLFSRKGGSLRYILLFYKARSPTLRARVGIPLIILKHFCAFANGTLFPLAAFFGAFILVVITLKTSLCQHNTLYLPHADPSRGRAKSCIFFSKTQNKLVFCRNKLSYIFR